VRYSREDLICRETPPPDLVGRVAPTWEYPVSLDIVNVTVKSH
jgi:hypothetical protein